VQLHGVAEGLKALWSEHFGFWKWVAHAPCMRLLQQGSQ